MRITPACAGKRWLYISLDLLAGDHPRVCGEKATAAGFNLRDVGSPPRVRGKGKSRRIPALQGGITPACAGKRTFAFSGSDVVKDHPRVCGEKLFRLPLFRLPLGSPPRVRGKVTERINNLHVNGITPACAGKSENYYSREADAQDHPRVCGEKCDFRREKYYSGGSPPRVRGKALRR